MAERQPNDPTPRRGPAARERGVTMLLTVALIITVAAFVLSGAGQLQALDHMTRVEFAAEAQAYSVAQAGLVDAYAWFRRQTMQPVTAFAPVRDEKADPPINETDDASEGLVRTFEISPGVWGRYTVLHGSPSETFDDLSANGVYDEGEPFTDTDGDGRRTAASGTRDVTSERGLAGEGTIWRLECLGQVFRRTRLDMELGEGPNIVVGSALLSTEIQRLPVIPPAAAAVYCSRGDRITVRDRTRIRAHSTAVAYPLGTGTPDVRAGAELSGAVAGAPVAGDRLVDVFGANLTDLQSMADISTRDPSTLPDALPPFSLVVVDGDLEFGAGRPLLGSGVLVVSGDLTIGSGSNSYYNGFIYVCGTFRCAAPSFIRGQVVAKESLLLEGGAADYAEFEHDNELVERLLAKMGNYRYSRAFFRPLPNHADGSPDRSFESRTGRGVGTKKPKKDKKDKKDKK